jgi:hypothetical protein
MVYYYNLGYLKKFRDKVLRDILMGYKGDIIYCILKPDNSYITCATAI